LNRLIVAQAKTNDQPLITKNRKIRQALSPVGLVARLQQLPVSADGYHEINLRPNQ
jgi:hypothetical protein